jgi:hypothetical protein
LARLVVVVVVMRNFLLVKLTAAEKSWTSSEGKEEKR